MTLALAAGLVLLRVVPLVALVPFLGGPRLSRPVAAAVLVAIAVVVLPVALAGAPASYDGGWFEILGLAVKELAVGTTIAVVASLMFWGVEMAGSVAEGLRGKPVRRAGPAGRSTALGTLGLLLTLAVYLAVGGHLLFVAALAESYAAVPLFSLPEAGARGFLLRSVLLAGEMFAVAALLALPAFVAVWLTDLGLGVLARMTPRWHALLLGMPARAMVVIIAFLLALHVFVDVAVDGSLTWLGALPAVLGGG